MVIEGKFFPSQEQEEKVFLLIRKHWFNYVIFFFTAFIMLIPVVILLVYWMLNPNQISQATGDIIILSLSAYFLFILGMELYGFVSYYLDVYIVTDRRIVDIDQEGFFHRKISELHLHQVQDVNARVEGFFQTILHFGDVYIQTAGEQENFVFQTIPHPYTIAKQIVDLHEHAIEEKNDLASEVKEATPANLPYDKLEGQAREMLNETPFSQRVKNQGIVVAPEVDIPLPKIIGNPDKTSNFTPPENEGELKEGREVDIEK